MQALPISNVKLFQGVAIRVQTLEKHTEISNGHFQTQNKSSNVKRNTFLKTSNPPSQKVAKSTATLK
jgi:hypothetical protein